MADRAHSIRVGHGLGRISPQAEFAVPARGSRQPHCQQPERVRLSVRRGMAPPAGAFIETKAQLNPPRQPLRPGSYDFARDLYFQKIASNKINGLYIAF